MKYLTLFLFACVTLYGAPFELVLTWTDNADNETGFRLYSRPTATAPWVVLADFDLPNVELYEDTFDAVGGEHIEYVVKAYNAEGESGPSNIATLDIPLPPLPPPTETGWIYWAKADGGVYVYSGTRWLWWSETTLPYYLDFTDRQWHTIDTTP